MKGSYSPVVSLFDTTGAILVDPPCLNPSPSEIVEGAERAERLHESMYALSTVERNVIIRRYGLYGTAMQTQEKIATERSTSRQAVGSAQRRAIDKLRIILRGIDL